MAFYQRIHKFPLNPLRLHHAYSLYRYRRRGNLDVGKAQTCGVSEQGYVGIEGGGGEGDAVGGET